MIQYLKKGKDTQARADADADVLGANHRTRITSTTLLEWRSLAGSVISNRDDSDGYLSSHGIKSTTKIEATEHLTRQAVRWSRSFYSSSH